MSLDKLSQQSFTASGSIPERVDDIAQFWIEEGWLYLAVIIDRYSRLAVSRALNRANDGSAGLQRVPEQSQSNALTLTQVMDRARVTL